MAERTITRAQLSESVYQEVGLSRNESADLLEMVLGEIASALTRGESVKISSFGSFSIRSKGQRVGRNPKTGEEVPILPRRVLVFRPSQLLKSRINDGVEAMAAGGLPGSSGTPVPGAGTPPVGGPPKRPA
ncbi:MAG TPA: integration host factor subunit alpha [Magnetospirillaceae bacterium]|jgi:integration host factor subunit alpha